MGEIRIVLDAESTTTTLEVEGEEARQGHWHRPALNKARSRFGEARRKIVRGTGREAALMAESGTALFDALFPEELSHALDDQVEAFLKARGSIVSLVFEVDSPVAASLPVESLISPRHGALGCHARLRLLRRSAPLLESGPLPAPPLRILFVVASPDSDAAKGRLLDFEREEWVLLQALQPLIAEGKAILETLEVGSLEAVKKALDAEPFHVLHYTGHAEPGVLAMEGPDGEDDPVSTQQLAELLGRFPTLRLVVLAGCATASSAKVESRSEPGTIEPEPGTTGREKSESGPAPEPEVLHGLAQSLSNLGVEFAIGMQDSVPDLTATRWAEAFYGSLVRGDVPAAFQDARAQVRQLEKERPAESGDWGQWPLPVLYQRAPEARLFDPDAPVDRSRARMVPPSPLYEGIAHLGVGRFIGRRTTRRELARKLRDSAVGGLVLHGLGGIGKSALATELAEQARKKGMLILARRAPVTLADLIRELQQVVNDLLLTPDLPQGLGQLCQKLQRLLGEGSNVDPTSQIEMGLRHLAPRVPLLLFLDNFEDQLETTEPGHRAIKDSELARVLGLWANQRGASKLLVTSRYPFALPGLPPSRLYTHMVGPLGRSEARKLMLRFPALRALSREELAEIQERLGGHPRSIEYLAAKLEHGSATWGEVGAELDRESLERQLDRSQIRHTESTLRETELQAAADLLLESLLEELSEGALDLVRRAAVFRQPVGYTGLAKLAEGREVTAEIEELVRLTLLYRETGRDGRPSYLVHRVTAESILDRAGSEIRTEAHQAAAEYLEYRVRHVSQNLFEHLEARWHWLQCGDYEQAARIALAAEDWLQRWGHWSLAEQLNQETWNHESLEPLSRASAAHNLGICGQLKGAYGDASDWYQKALAIFEELGNRTGMATSYHELGRLAQARGAYGDASDWYQKALAILEELGNRPGMANSYGQLGTLAQNRGDYGDANDWYQKALVIFEELGNRTGMAGSYHQLGMLAQDRGAHGDASDWYQKALAIKEEMRNRPGMANSYHQLGTLAQTRGDYEDASDWYQKALAIDEELGNRPGMATSYSQMGILLTERGRTAEAVALTLRSLSLRLELGVPQVEIDLRQLVAEENQLGNAEFERVVKAEAGEESWGTIRSLMDQAKEAAASEAENPSVSESE